MARSQLSCLLTFILPLGSAFVFQKPTLHTWPKISSVKATTNAAGMRTATNVWLRRRDYSNAGLRTCRANLDAFSMMSPAFQAVTGAVSSISGLAVLAFVIAFHEAGHFLAAKAQGIRVKDFSIGFGPKLLSYTDRDGVCYSLRALPIGGYVSFPVPKSNLEDLDEDDSSLGAAAARKAKERQQENGEEDEEQVPEDDPDLLQNRPAIQRALVISAGVVFNMLLAWAAILVIVTSSGVPDIVLRPGVTISQITDLSGSGAQAGLRAGDVILSVDGMALPGEEESTPRLVRTVRAAPGETLHLMVERAGSPGPVAMDVVPEKRGDTGIIGVRLGPNIDKMVVKRPASAGEALAMSFSEFQRIFQRTFDGLVRTISNFNQAGSSNLAGPVGVIQMGAEAGKQGVLLSFAAAISINLGFMNALPLPALDGGQLLLILVEVARGKPVDPELTRAVNGFFLSLLVTISMLLLVGDLGRLIR